ncbi:MAG: hypothetical protein EXS13_01320 [Planctomycetes bacterium]|nr:hypothetical protein [Planctomycetota bacterium]
MTAAPTLIRGGPATSPVNLAIVTTAFGSEIWKLPDTLAAGPEQIVDAPGLALRGAALRADGAEAAFIASAGPGIEQVFAVDLVTGRVRVLTPVARFAGATTSYSPSRRVLFTWSTTGTSQLAAFAEAPAGSGLVRRLAKTGRQPQFLTR